MPALVVVPIKTPDGASYNVSVDLDVEVSDSKISLITPAPPAILEPVIPANAVAVDMLPAAWACNHDGGTGGSATGSSSYPVAAPDGSTGCRVFSFSLTNKGGFIYHVNALQDSSPFNTFCYETEEYFVDPTNLQCMEKDLEQVDSTGKYVDMATQLDGNSGTLDYTGNQTWLHSQVKANPTAIAPKLWYKTRRYVKNMGNGQACYIGSNDNGIYSPLGITVKSQPAALWGKNLLNVQYQFGGKSAGSVVSTVYARLFRIHCWKS